MIRHKIFCCTSSLDGQEFRLPAVPRPGDVVKVTAHLDDTGLGVRAVTQYFKIDRVTFESNTSVVELHAERY